MSDWVGWWVCTVYIVQCKPNNYSPACKALSLAFIDVYSDLKYNVAIFLSGIERANQNIWESGTGGVQGGWPIPRLCGPTKLHPVWLGEHCSQWAKFILNVKLKLVPPRSTERTVVSSRGKSVRKAKWKTEPCFKLLPPLARRSMCVFSLIMGEMEIWIFHNSSICREIRLPSKYHIAPSNRKGNTFLRRYLSRRVNWGVNSDNLFSHWLPSTFSSRMIEYKCLFSWLQPWIIMIMCKLLPKWFVQSVQCASIHPWKRGEAKIGN